MSEEFNPIIRKEEFKGKIRLGSERPKPNVSTALVFVKDGKIVSTIKEGDRANWGILIWDGYDSMYEVDLALVRLDFKMTDLPSKDSSTKMFEAVVSFTCKADPENLSPIIKEKITNVENILSPGIEALIRRQTDSYSIEKRREAESEICEDLKKTAIEFASRKGFLIDNITLKLSLNSEARKFLSDLEKTSDTLIQNKAQHSVDTQSVGQQSELEMMRTMNEINIQKIKQESEMTIMQQKVQMYELMLKAGSLDAFRLAQDPSAAERIRNEQIQGDILKMKFTLEGFVSMAETGAIAAPELAEHAKRLLSSNLFSNASEAPANVLGITDGNQQREEKEVKPAGETTVIQKEVSREEIENPDMNDD